MKKLFLLSMICLVLGACAFHAKQPIDDNYYKKTRGVAWPEESATAQK